MKINGIFIFITMSVIFFVNSSAQTIDFEKTWNVVATAPLHINFPDAQCWTVKMTKRSSKLLTGHTKYFDNTNHKIKKLTLQAQITDNVLSVFIYQEISNPLMKLTVFPITQNLLECMIFSDRSDYLGRIFLSSSPTLSNDEELMLQSQNVQVNVNNTNCPALIARRKKSYNIDESTDFIKSIEIKSNDPNVGNWNVVAVSSRFFPIPKICNWTINLSKISSTLYNGFSSYLNFINNERVNIEFDAHSTNEEFFKVSLSFESPIPIVWVSKMKVTSDLMEWTISHPEDSTILGRFWVTRNSYLPDNEKIFLRNQGVDDFIDTNCAF